MSVSGAKGLEEKCQFVQQFTRTKLIRPNN